MAITSYSGKNMKHGKRGKKNFVPRNKGNSDQRLRLNCDALSEKGRERSSCPFEASPIERSHPDDLKTRGALDCLRRLEWLKKLLLHGTRGASDEPRHLQRVGAVAEGISRGASLIERSHPDDLKTRGALDCLRRLEWIKKLLSHGTRGTSDEPRHLQRVGAVVEGISRGVQLSLTKVPPTCQNTKTAKEENMLQVTGMLDSFVHSLNCRVSDGKLELNVILRMQVDS
ncbi:hypothetical protein ZIOFF_014804 [Zingiber officinale]|uniref:Uncharacterized protein n=1 Tax=Zingiber officinale TaxID=94328 RepID=A0A8J5HBE0_ZINOF|nr:hypothetical protein ZIOFF_014804 [Zingiber officinale]